MATHRDRVRVSDSTKVGVRSSVRVGNLSKLQTAHLVHRRAGSCVDHVHISDRVRIEPSVMVSTGWGYISIVSSVSG